jgi:hypothetical protein
MGGVYPISLFVPFPIRYAVYLWAGTGREIHQQWLDRSGFNAHATAAVGVGLSIRLSVGFWPESCFKIRIF